MATFNINDLGIKGGDLIRWNNPGAFLARVRQAGGKQIFLPVVHAKF